VEPRSPERLQVRRWEEPLGIDVDPAVLAVVVVVELEKPLDESTIIP